ncbi:MAG: hypothetical protein A2X37_06205 [Elusimicrobia bacterium GWA2_66_18]|nr:MAG: hypothetical protein A2X37_06205 [Elusimicrobia bacterium GWA2_66_18]
MLVSYYPPGEALTYYYWDDWALSGILKPGGHTLTLGLAGASGPRRLALTDKTHRQTGVDLDTSQHPSCDWDLTAVKDDAFRFIAQTQELFDTIWVDLYGAEGVLLPRVLAPEFIAQLRSKLKPDGIVFVHLFRPENRFYRYARAHDPFEPLFREMAESMGFHAAVFDHYASQTWVFSNLEVETLRRELITRAATPPEIFRWLREYMAKILRQPNRTGSLPHDLLSDVEAAFKAPIAPAAMVACGLSAESGAEDWESWSETPERLIAPEMEMDDPQRLRLETLALWLTAPGLKLPTSCREYLARTVGQIRATGAPEFELRRALMK